jgi:hypothetical protein
VFYTRNMTDVVSGKLSLENQLRQAWRTKSSFCTTSRRYNSKAGS